jgi:hypothetical protein
MNQTKPTPTPPPSYLRTPQRLNDRPTATRNKVLGCGDTGTGKTHLGGTFPGMRSGKAVIIDVDGSLRGLPSGINPDVYTFYQHEVNNPDRIKRIPLFKILYNLISEMIPNPNNYETLMIDGVTTLAQFLINECQWDPTIDKQHDPTKAKPSWDEYDTLKSRLQSLFTLIDALPMHVYVTAMIQKDKDDTTGRITGMPMCLGSFRQEMGRHFDAQVYSERTVKGDIVLNTTTINNIPSKIRKYIGPLQITNPTYDMIFDPKNFK